MDDEFRQEQLHQLDQLQENQQESSAAPDPLQEDEPRWRPTEDSPLKIAHDAQQEHEEGEQRDENDENDENDAANEITHPTDVVLGG